MIYKVLLTARALKQLQTVPMNIRIKLFNWQKAVMESGLETVRRIPGYHDEPLKGRRKGQRSIRLSRAYRAIYIIKDDGQGEVVSIEEVNRHEY